MNSTQSQLLEIKQRVLTPRGEIPIEQIQIGDEVIGFNYDTKQKEVYIVTQKGPFGTDRKYITEDGKYHYDPHKSKEFIEVNQKHYFAPHQSLYANGVVVHAMELKLGDFIEDIYGNKFRVETLERVKSDSLKILLSIERKRTKLQKLFRLKKTDHHTYYINGILVHNASRYWVGGTATWDGTAGSKWSGSSGGGGGSSVPTAADDVFFDAASGAVTITTSGTTTDLCRSLDCNGFTGTLNIANSTTIVIGDATAGAGNRTLRLVSGMTLTVGGTASNISIVTTSATQQTVNTGGKGMPTVTFNGSASSHLLSDNWTSASATNGFIILTAGTLNTNNVTISTAGFTWNGASSTLTLGSTSWTVTNNSGSPWGATTPGTLNAGTSTITVSGAAAVTFAGGSRTYNNVTRTSSSQFTITGANTYNNLNWTQTVAGTQTAFLVLPSTQTQTITGTLTLVGLASGVSAGRIYIIAGGFVSNPANAVTINAAAVSLTNVDFSDVNATGAATWTGTSLGNAGGNTGITFTTPTIRYWVGNAGNWANPAQWSTSSGGASGASIPLAQDNVIFDANSITLAAQTIGINIRLLGKDLDFSAVLNSPIFSIGTFNPGICGSLTFGTGMTTNSTTSATINLIGRGSHNLTLNGCTISTLLTITTFSGGTYTLQDALTMPAANTLSIASGNFVVNNVNLSVGLFTSSGTSLRSITMGSGIWTLTGTGSVWNIGTPTNCTLTPNTSTLAITDTSATAKNINTGGATNTRTLYNVSITPGGTGAIVIQNNLITNSFSINGGPKTLTINNAVSLTANKTLHLLGSSGNIITLNSGTPGTPVSIISSASVISCDWLSIQDSAASGGATFYAGANSTNVSGNTGWIFTAGASSSTITETPLTLTETLKRDTSRFLTERNFPSDHGFGIKFDGVQNFLSLGTMGSFGSNMALGFYMKFKMKTTSTAVGAWGVDNNSFGNNTLQLAFNIGPGGAGAGRFRFKAQDNTGKVLYAGTNTNTGFTDGNDHEIEIIANFATNTLTINVDGAPQTITYTFQTTPNTFINFPNPFYIGAQRQSGVAASFYDCTIDDLLLGTSAGNLFGSYNFNVRTLADGSGQGNTATFGGDPTPDYVPGLTVDTTLTKAIGKFITEFNPARLEFDGQNYLSLGALAGWASQFMTKNFYIEFIIQATTANIFIFHAKHTSGSQYIRVHAYFDAGLGRNILGFDVRDSSGNMGNGYADVNLLDGLSHEVSLVFLVGSNVKGVTVDGVGYGVAGIGGQQVMTNFSDFDDIRFGREVGGSAVNGFKGSYLHTAHAQSWPATVTFSEYDINEGSGTVIADKSGNGRHGTLIGSPLPTWIRDEYYENLKRDTTTVKSDSITLNETLLKQTSKLFTESVTLNETLLKAIAKTIVESVTLTETLLKAVTKSYTESVTLTETLLKVMGKTITEAVTLTETLVKAISKTIIESISFLEIIFVAVPAHTRRATVLTIKKTRTILSTIKNQTIMRMRK